MQSCSSLYVHMDGQGNPHTEDEQCRKDFMSSCGALEYLLVKNRMLLPAIFIHSFLQGWGEVQLSMYVRQELNCCCV